MQPAKTTKAKDDRSTTKEKDDYSTSDDKKDDKNADYKSTDDKKIVMTNRPGMMTMGPVGQKVTKAGS